MTHSYSQLFVSQRLQCQRAKISGPMPSRQGRAGSSGLFDTQTSARRQQASKSDYSCRLLFPLRLMSQASCVYPTGQQLLLPPPWHPRRQTCQPRSCDTRLVRGPGRSSAAHEQGRPDGGMADPTTCFRQRDDAAVLFWKERGRGNACSRVVFFSFASFAAATPCTTREAVPIRRWLYQTRHDHRCSKV